VKTSKEAFYWLAGLCGAIIMAFIVIPLAEVITQPSWKDLADTLKDRDVIRSIWLSVYTSAIAAGISLVLGTPFAYLLARREFFGKKLIESMVDLPIMIPHPVVGIAILSVAGQNHWLGSIMQEIGIRVMGSVTGIVAVMTFVGMPFYVNAVKNGFQSIPQRLENVSRSLGASMTGTFFRITLPLAWRSILVGMIMCCARAISEFGAVVIIAYHPMVAPVMIYERFEAYGLKYSQPMAVWLIVVCLFLFLMLRLVSVRKGKA
jgi:molybdate/tungstate transport system permease protein